MTWIRDRVRMGLRGCVLAAISLLAIGLVVLLVIAAVPDRVGLLLSVTAASIPALIYATIVLRLDRCEIEPLRAVLACFAWGAVGAILFSLATGLHFQFAVEELLGAEAEEAASVVIGGALVGVGFAMTENILYFGQAYLEGGLGEFGTLVLSRAVLGGLGHPAYTAITGAAIGWSRGRYGRGVARVIVPAVLVLYAIARMSARHELRILREELCAEVERGTITQAEYESIVDAQERQRALASAQARGGRALRRRQQAFFNTAADLAFRNHHRHQGEPSKPSQTTRDDTDRERLFAPRSELAPDP